MNETMDEKNMQNKSLRDENIEEDTVKVMEEGRM